MNRKEHAVEKLVDQYRISMPRESVRIPRYQLMLINQLSEWYSVSKPHILRLMIEHCRTLDEMEEVYSFPKSKFLNAQASIAFQLDTDGMEYLEDLSKHLGISKNHAVSLIIANAIDAVGNKLDNSRVHVADPRNSLVVRGVYVSAELHAALMELRDRYGESVSLLLKTAIEEHRTRTIEPDDSFRVDKKVSLRMNAGNFDKMKVLCVSSNMNLNEGFSGLMKNFYFGAVA